MINVELTSVLVSSQLEKAQQLEPALKRIRKLWSNMPEECNWPEWYLPEFEILKRKLDGITVKPEQESPSELLMKAAMARSGKWAVPNGGTAMKDKKRLSSTIIVICHRFHTFV